MDYIISQKISNDRLYAYAKNRFWFWDDVRQVWKESHLLSKKYEVSHEADQLLSPEDFLSDYSNFQPLENFQIDIIMRQALENAEPCKNAPIEPVAETKIPCKCSTCICSGCKEECFGNCHHCGHPVEDCNSYQTEGEKPLSTDIAEPLGNSSASPVFDFSALGDLSGQASEADAQFDLHYGAAQDEYLISCIYLAKIHALTAKAGRYGGGTWTKWYESKGISEGSARNMVKNGEAFKSATVAELKQLPELTRKDLNLIARSGCAEQLTEAAGDSQRVQELLAQIKAKDKALSTEKERADAAEAREEEVWKTYNAESSKRQKAEADLKETRARLDSACIQEQNARDAMQAAESARDAALADVQGLSEQNNRLKAENADLKKGKPLATVVDEEEVDRLATEKAWGLADARNAELAERNADLERQLAEALDANNILTAQAEKPETAYDPTEDLETADNCSVNVEGIWSMTRPAFTRLVGTGEEFNRTAHALIQVCDRIHAECVKMIIQNDKETLYD